MILTRPHHQPVLCTLATLHSYHQQAVTVQLSPVFAAIEPKRAHLSDIIRQGEDNPIIELSAALRRVMAASAHITVSDVVEMVNEYDKDGAKIGMIKKHEIADYCSDALKKNGMDCRYLAYRNESIDKQTIDIRKMLHGRDVAKLCCW